MRFQRLCFISLAATLTGVLFSAGVEAQRKSVAVRQAQPNARAALKRIAVEDLTPEAFGRLADTAVLAKGDNQISVGDLRRLATAERSATLDFFRAVAIAGAPELAARRQEIAANEETWRTAEIAAANQGLEQLRARAQRKLKTPRERRILKRKGDG